MVPSRNLDHHHPCVNMQPRVMGQGDQDAAAAGRRARTHLAHAEKNAYSRTVQRVMSSGARSSQQPRKPRRQLGSRKPSKTGAKVLRTMWAERLRQRGYIDPTRVHTLSKLRPRGCRYAVVPGACECGVGEKIMCYTKQCRSMLYCGTVV